MGQTIVSRRTLIGGIAAASGAVAFPMVNFGAYSVHAASRRTYSKRVVDLDLDYLADAERRAYQSELERLVADGSAVQRESVLPFADGKPHHTLYSASAFRKADGTPGGLVGVMVDIEPMKIAERALNEALERQKAIFETSPHGIAVVRERQYLQTNSSLERMFGYAPGEMVGKPTRATYESDASFRSFGERAAISRLRTRSGPQPSL